MQVVVKVLSVLSLHLCWAEEAEFSVSLNTAQSRCFLSALHEWTCEGGGEREIDYNVCICGCHCFHFLFLLFILAHHARSSTLTHSLYGLINTIKNAFYFFPRHWSKHGNMSSCPDDPACFNTQIELQFFSPFQSISPTSLLFPYLAPSLGTPDRVRSCQ